MGGENIAGNGAELVAVESSSMPGNRLPLCIVKCITANSKILACFVTIYLC